jgi:hypothetical protein
MCGNWRKFNPFLSSPQNLRQRVKKGVVGCGQIKKSDWVFGHWRVLSSRESRVAVLWVCVGGWSMDICFRAKDVGWMKIMPFKWKRSGEWIEMIVCRYRRWHGLVMLVVVFFPFLTCRMRGNFSGCRTRNSMNEKCSAFIYMLNKLSASKRRTEQEIYVDRQLFSSFYVNMQQCFFRQEEK